ncbi:hypothetical protein PsorP6_007342 [Peronosclerospora sorghi]|uniref:Uncharacterized protein n=1 Tax=Peronosclerospora sorghi TaxID=230839 RepID=A0ACC0WAD9_9STRA|nr:hypothetical protein PsorP6_007342 [Peronosclerospora sorghi]
MRWVYGERQRPRRKQSVSPRRQGGGEEEEEEDTTVPSDVEIDALLSKLFEYGRRETCLFLGSSESTASFQRRQQHGTANGRSHTTTTHPLLWSRPWSYASARRLAPWRGYESDTNEHTPSVSSRRRNDYHWAIDQAASLIAGFVAGMDARQSHSEQRDQFQIQGCTHEDGWMESSRHAL